MHGAGDGTCPGPVQLRCFFFVNGSFAPNGGHSIARDHAQVGRRPIVSYREALFEDYVPWPMQAYGRVRPGGRCISLSSIDTVAK